MTLPPWIRELMLRHQQICPVCLNGFQPEQRQHIHHVHERSSIRLKGVRDQIWNLARLHEDQRYEARDGKPLLCHTAAHKDRRVRQQLEAAAIEKLRDLTQAIDIDHRLAEIGKVDEAWKLPDRQFLRAYELWWISEYGKK